MQGILEESAGEAGDAARRSVSLPSVGSQCKPAGRPSEVELAAQARVVGVGLRVRGQFESQRPAPADRAAARIRMLLMMSSLKEEAILSASRPMPGTDELVDTLPRMTKHGCISRVEKGSIS